MEEKLLVANFLILTSLGVGGAGGISSMDLSFELIVKGRRELTTALLNMTDE